MGLVAAYDLGEAAGAARADAVSGYDLTDHNGVGQGTGVLGSCATFNGSSQWLSHAANVDFGWSATMGFSLWVKLNSTAATQTILAKWNSGAFEYILQFDSGAGRFILYAGNFASVSNGNVGLSGSPTISTGTWYHIACGFLNGKSFMCVNAGPRALSAGTPSASGGLGDFILGKNQDGDQQYLNGSIDQVAVWKDTSFYTSAFVQALYNAGDGRASGALPRSILDLSFANVLAERPVTVLSPVGQLITSQAVPGTTYDIESQTGTPTTALAAGTASFTRAGASFNKAYVSGSVVVAPCAACKITLTSLGAPSGADTWVTLGLFQDANNWVGVRYYSDHSVAWLAKAAGTLHTSGPFSISAPTGTPTLYCAVNENEMAFWIEDDNGLTYLGTFAVGSYFDMTLPATLAAMPFGYAVGYTGSSATPIQLSGWRAGYFGCVGRREHFPVTVYSATAAQNGQPYLKGTKFYCLVDNTAPTSQTDTDAIRPTHQGVYEVDFSTPASPVMTEVAKLFVSRGGHVYTDQDGRMVWDKPGAKWRLVMQTWGSIAAGGAVDTSYFESAADLLSGVHVLTPSKTLTLSTATSNYDVAFRYDPGAALWDFVFSYTSSRNLPWTFAPALNTVNDPASGTFTDVADRTVTENREGTSWTKVGAEDWALSTLSSTTAEVYYAADLAELGDAPIALPGGTGAGLLNPHLNVVALPKAGGGTIYYATSFDNALYNSVPYSQGATYLYRADPGSLWAEFDWLDFTGGGKLFRAANLNGLGAGGPFFGSPEG